MIIYDVNQQLSEISEDLFEKKTMDQQQVRFSNAPHQLASLNHHVGVHPMINGPHPTHHEQEEDPCLRKYISSVTPQSEIQSKCFLIFLS